LHHEIDGNLPFIFLMGYSLEKSGLYRFTINDHRFFQTASDIISGRSTGYPALPHRSGREELPHPVPQKTQAVRLRVTKQILLRLTHNSATRVDFTVSWVFVDLVCDHRVSPIVRPRKTLYLVSPSLQWVPWALVPHLHRRKASIGTMIH